MSTTFLLVRHGECDGLGERLNGRQPGVRLSERGKQQAEALGARLGGLPIAAVYASPLERTMATAAPLAARLGLTLQELPAFLEIDFGDFTGRSFAELEPLPEWRQWNQFRGGTSIPGGERVGSLLARTLSGLDELTAWHENQTVAIFSHCDVIRAVLLHYLGAPFEFNLRVEISPASVSVLELGEWGPKITAINHGGALGA